MKIKKTKLNLLAFIMLSSQMLFLGTTSLSPFMVRASTDNNFYVTTYYAIQSGNNLILRGRISYPPKNTTAWFKWGKTPYMEYSTTPVELSYIPYMREIDFSKKIFNLRKNTTYYYQLVTKTINGDRKYGRRLSTTTGWDGVNSLPETNSSYTQPNTNNGNQNTNTQYYNTTTSPTSPIAVTLLPSLITTTKITMRGLALPGSAMATKSWFEFGATISLGKQTTHRNIPSNARSIEFKDTILNLSPNTTYYYRAVIKNINGTSYGNILKTKTSNQIINKTTTITTTKKIVKKANKQITRKKERTTNSSLASTFASNGAKFMPHTLIEWLILLLTILAILAMSDHIYITRKKRREESANK